MPTWIWNIILRQWWNSSTNGEIDSIYRWSNRAQTSQQVTRYLDRYRKSFKVESCGEVQACSNDQDLFPVEGDLVEGESLEDSETLLVGSSQELWHMFVLQLKCSSTVCWNAPWWTWFVPAQKTFLQSWGRRKFTYDSEFAMTKQSDNYRL